MVAWGPLQRRLFAYIARHPQFQQAVRNVGQRVVAHPTFQKAKQSAYSAFEKAGTRAARGGTVSGAKGCGSTEESTLHAWRRRINDGWHKHKAGVMSFIAANFMAILIFVQVSPMMWNSVKRGIHYLTEAPSNAEGERKEKPRKRKAEAAEEQSGFKAEAPNDTMRGGLLRSVPSPQTPWGSRTEHGEPASRPSQSWQTSSSLFDDTVGAMQQPDAQQSFNEMHKDLFRTPDGSAQINFDTSFLVKMGDETTFTSSLEREALTGSVSSHSL
ncbi:conserved hypothetical protein [Leishmania mexicana MHOM/GT/2001/U1103]|uniref:Transmembrane protein n=1 Tax=Leishmania mexicana (strain MHOM/GT/2001/U1103) TaxID=929439 RepID=E9APJ7_LEIMU|nr:conserved hypothetical protein [Leishmania mexicana MHOM/GT/2001/U1103]CBZ24861.1 conserved hypothetical protein [Leishmania mexicana MHOM/GT/2001/U1103]